MASTPGGTGRPRHRPWHAPIAAAIGACVFAGLSLTPSLMPRAGVIQGVVTGLAAATGYGVGLLLAWIVREATGRPGPSWGSPRSWRLVTLVGGGSLAVLAVLGKSWQDEVRTLMGSPSPSAAWYPQALVVAALIVIVLVGAARVVRRGARAVRRFAERFVPPRAATATGVVVAGGLTVALLQGLVVDVLYPILDRAFATISATVDPEVPRPSSDRVSGGPASVVRWEELGADGRSFIAATPSRDRVAAVTGTAQADPIRVYVGLDSDPDPERRAALAVDELERFGAFDRSVLLLATSTGTGYLDQSAVEPVEVMYAGDSAVVSTQYSHLPSWLSFVVDQDRARAAARALFDAVYDRWSDLPDADRPVLLVFGESLGSLGAEASFTGIPDMANRTDGALLVGPPSMSPLHASVTADRDPGSPQWQPVHEQGRTLRFGRDAADLTTPPAGWDAPRLVYLQNSSDPVVWWSPDLVFSTPDWLVEPRGPDVSSRLRWWPLLTFLQLSGDMMDSTSVPAGHGHVYGYAQAEAWALIAPPPGWTESDTGALVALYR